MIISVLFQGNPRKNFKPSKDVEKIKSNFYFFKNDKAFREFDYGIASISPGEKRYITVYINGLKITRFMFDATDINNIVYHKNVYHPSDRDFESIKNLTFSDAESREHYFRLQNRTAAKRDIEEYERRLKREKIENLPRNEPNRVIEPGD